MISNFAKLVNSGKTAHDDPVTDMDMATQRGVIGKNGVIADLAIVGQVTISQHPVVVSQARNTSILSRTKIERTKFANKIAFTNLETRFFITIFLILRD